MTTDTIKRTMDDYLRILPTEGYIASRDIADTLYPDLERKKQVNNVSIMLNKMLKRGLVERGPDRFYHPGVWIHTWRRVV